MQKYFKTNYGYNNTNPEQVGGQRKELCSGNSPDYSGEKKWSLAMEECKQHINENYSSSPGTQNGLSRFISTTCHLVRIRRARTVEPENSKNHL